VPLSALVLLVGPDDGKVIRFVKISAPESLLTENWTNSGKCWRVNWN